jgi:hypothetical protein
MNGIYGLGRFQREQPTMQLCASMALSLYAILILPLKLRSVTEIPGVMFEKAIYFLPTFCSTFHRPPSRVTRFTMFPFC